MAARPSPCAKTLPRRPPSPPLEPPVCNCRTTREGPRIRPRKPSAGSCWLWWKTYYGNTPRSTHRVKTSSYHKCFYFIHNNFSVVLLDVMINCCIHDDWFADQSNSAVCLGGFPHRLVCIRYNLLFIISRCCCSSIVHANRNWIASLNNVIINLGINYLHHFFVVLL